jgi:hypothetical protein
MEKPIFKTRRFTWNISYMLLMELAMLSGSCILLWKAATNNDQRIFHLRAGIALGLVFTGLFILTYKVLEVYQVFSDRIRVLSLFGYEKRALLLTEIHSWTETERNSKNGKDYIITLYAGKTKIRFDSNILGKSDYLSLKQLVTRGILEDKRMELDDKIRGAKAGIRVSVIFLVLLIPGFLKFWYTGLHDLKFDHFTTVRDQISRPPRIEYSKSKPNILLIYLRGDINATVIDDYTTQATDVLKFSNDVNVGDFVIIEKVRATPVNILQKIFGNQEPYICGLRTDSYSYLNFDNFSRFRKNSNQKVYYFFGGMLLFFGLIILSSRMSQKDYRKMQIELDQKSAAESPSLTAL